jgi:hypothetical protein
MTTSNAGRIWLLVALMCLLGLVPRAAGAQDRMYIGCGGPNPFHDWWYMWPWNPIVTIDGTIHGRTKLNIGSWEDDSDWNIYISPFSNAFLHNDEGEDNPDPWVEAEVMTHNWQLVRDLLPDAFPEGTQVEARGYSKRGLRSESWLRLILVNHLVPNGGWMPSPVSSSPRTGCGISPTPSVDWKHTYAP